MTAANATDEEPRFENPLPIRTRYVVSGWLAGFAVFAYLCRNSIVVAEKTVRTDLGLTEDEMGFVLGAFFWTYALAQIPTGWLGARYGSRVGIPLLAVAWSLATGWFSIAHGKLSLLLARSTMGVAQAGLFPCSTNTISHWHPPTERAMASGVLAASMSIGGAIGVALTGTLLEIWDWRWIFAAYSIPSIVWAFGFAWWFRDDPVEHSQVSQAELDEIRPESDQSARTKTTPTIPWIELLTSPAMWMISSQQFFRAAGYAFFASWFATYLQETRGVTTGESGWLTAIPLIAIVFAAISGGGLSDFVFRRTGSLALARKGIAIMALTICAALVFSAYFVSNALLAVIIISAGAYFAGFAGPCAYASTIDLGGRHVASVFATMNMVGNFGAGLLPMIVPVVRRLVDNNEVLLEIFGGNSWNAVLVLFAGMYVAAAGCWMLLRVDRNVVEQALIGGERDA